MVKSRISTNKILEKENMNTDKAIRNLKQPGLEKMPPIYQRNGRECYLDPIRKKLIYITPEETVRQKVIAYLIDTLNVPVQEIISEQNLSHYGIKTQKRADIVVHAVDHEGQSVPIAVVECKAPNVYLDLKAKEQMFEYCDMLGASYAMLTNGIDQYCFKYDPQRDEYVTLVNFPDYKAMLSDQYEELDIGELPPRIPFDQLENYLKEDFSQREEWDYGDGISKLTPLNQAVPVFNFWEGLLDTRVKMPVGKYGIFELIEDYGVRMLSYGNASGGKFFGPYRSFLVRVNGNVEFFSIGVTIYCKSTSPDHVKTCIVVAHDDEKEAHHALQLVVEDNVTVIGNKVSFYHHGKIAVGRQGSGKIDELRDIVEGRYPKIISGKRFFLGSIVNDRLWLLDDPAVIELIENLISYAIVRDEYREYVKKHRN